MRLFVPALTLATFASQVAFAAVDSTLLAMAPSASTVLAGIDVNKARHSSSGALLLKQAMANQKLMKLAAITGLNVNRDLRQILLVGVGRQANLDSPDVVIADGTFNATSLIAAARSRGASMRKYQGFQIIVAEAGNPAPLLAFPQPGVLVIGMLATVEALLASSTVPSSLDPGLRTQLEQIGEASDLWYATILSGTFLLRQIGNTLPTKVRDAEVLRAITQSSGGLQFGQFDTMTLNLISPSTGYAQLLSALLRLASGVVRFQSGGDASQVAAESALSSIHVTTEGPRVQATGTIPDEQLAQAISSNK